MSAQKQTRANCYFSAFHLDTFSLYAIYLFCFVKLQADLKHYRWIINV